MVKILCIGNSFSQDANAYFHDLAARGGKDVKAVNLYIGGCPLKAHWENAQSGAAAYDYELNGHGTGRKISISDALAEEGWDFVTLQQASHDSGQEETYQPYLNELSAWVRQRAPHARQLIHETWAYETDSAHSEFARYGNDQQVMYDRLRAAYQKAAAAIGAPIIPSGDVIQALRGLPAFDYPHGGQSLCRDGFHMHLVYGRYAVAATWYETVLGGNVLENDFVPPAQEQPADPHLLHLIAQTTHTVCAAQRAER